MSGHEMSSRAFPLQGRWPLVFAGLGLALLMALTRGQHAASVGALPSASWAVFFLAGMLLRPAWALPLLVLLATGIDTHGFATERVLSHCITPAYATLVMAYTVLWMGGRVYARWHRDDLWLPLRLAAVLGVVAVIAYPFSGGGFYFLSGNVEDPTLMGFAQRMAQYLPLRLTNLALYVAAAFALRCVWMAIEKLRNPRPQASA